MASFSGKIYELSQLNWHRSTVVCYEKRDQFGLIRKGSEIDAVIPNFRSYAYNGFFVLWTIVSKKFKADLMLNHDTIGIAPMIWYGIPN